MLIALAEHRLKWVRAERSGKRAKTHSFRRKIHHFGLKPESRHSRQPGSSFSQGRTISSMSSNSRGG
jgi:hypothetical protein